MKIETYTREILTSVEERDKYYEDFLKWYRFTKSSQSWIAESAQRTMSYPLKKLCSLGVKFVDLKDNFETHIDLWGCNK